MFTNCSKAIEKLLSTSISTGSAPVHKIELIEAIIVKLGTATFSFPDTKERRDRYNAIVPFGTAIAYLRFT